jgi:DNA-binding NarL/FixJ family response regulator
MRELPGPQGDAPPLRILHIEDDPGDALLVRRLLREMSGDNLRLVQAGTLSEGAADDHDPYDLAVLDLDLPDCRGLETIRRFRAARPDTPFLVLSANMDREIGLDALGHGAGAYVQKDRLTSTLLERRVQQTLARSRGPVNGTANPSAIVTPIPWPPTAPLPVDTMRLVVVRLANAGQSFDSPEPAWTVDPFEDATDPERRMGPQDLEEIAHRRARGFHCTAPCHEPGADGRRLPPGACRSPRGTPRRAPVRSVNERPGTRGHLCCPRPFPIAHRHASASIPRLSGGPVALVAGAQLGALAARFRGSRSGHGQGPR